MGVARNSTNRHTMQAFRRTPIVAVRQASRSTNQAAFTTSIRRFEEAKSTPPPPPSGKAPESAKDSFKRGAQNTAGFAGTIGKKVVNALNEVGDAARGIVGDGVGEAKATKDTASQIVRDRISGKNKGPKA